LELDELIQQRQVKLKIDAMRSNDPALVERQYECDHEGTIERLTELIKRKEQAIFSLQERVSDQMQVKEREMANANDRLKTAKKELKAMNKKSQMTDSDRLMALQEKI